MSLMDHIVRERREARLSLFAARKALRLWLETNPQVAVPIGRTRRAVRLAAFDLRARMADARSGDPYLNAGRVVNVPTAALRRRTGLPYGYDPARRPGAVEPGDWDRPRQTILETPYWSEFRDALRGKRPWESTSAYHAVMGRGESETRAWRRRILLADGRRVIRGYETLYESMRSTGCLPQRELAKRRGVGYRPTNTDDISVAVGRDGELLLCQGGHRVETARALGIESVPVWVGVRHPDWWAFRRRVVAYADAHGGRVPEPLLHPDLDNIPYTEDCRSSFDLLVASLSSGKGRLVDLSPGWGYFLHRFEERGFDCAGVPSDIDDRYFLERLRVAGDRRFAIVEEAELPRGTPGPVIAVLLLRGGDAWLGSAAARERLEALLTELRPQHVFIERPAGSAEWAQDTALEAGSEELRACTAAMTSPRIRLLGRVDGRSLYGVSDDDWAGGRPE